MLHNTTTVISHEFMHAIGFNHEQNRGDQAQNVRIHYGWFQVFSGKLARKELTLETNSQKILIQDYILLSRLCQTGHGCPLVMDMILIQVLFRSPA